MKIDIGMNFYMENITDCIFQIFDDKDTLYFRYHFEPAHKLCLQTWYHEISDEQIIHIYKTFGKYSFEKQHQMIASITQVNNLKDSFHLTNEWVIQKFIAKAVLYGYKYAFLVNTEEIMTQLALEDAVDLLREVDGLVEVRMFETFQEAYQYAKDILDKEQ